MRYGFQAMLTERVAHLSQGRMIMSSKQNEVIPKTDLYDPVPT
jgi:hypothetical protein